MDRKLICFVLVALLVASMVDAAASARPPQRQRRYGKRDSQAGLKKREYCARAKMICSPEANGFNDEADDMDLNVEDK